MIGKILLKNKYKIHFAILSAIIVGLIAQILSYSFNVNYAYRDSIFKMEAARRFFDSLNPGFFNQIGTVWLPIPNIILMPFASIDFLFETGLAASIVYYPLFIISALFIFLSLKELTNDSTATWIGFIIYILNYNILYFQTTAMSEQIYLFFILGNFYYLVLWAKYFEYKHLFVSSIFLTFAVGTRYDAWPIFIVSFIIVLVICINNRKSIPKILLFYFTIPFLFIIWWFIHNFIFYGDPLEFARGKFSTLHQLNYYIEHGRLTTKDDFWISFKVYTFSVLIYSGYLYFILSILGLIYYFIKNKFDTRSFIPYILLVPFPVSLILLFKGQIILENQLSEPEGFFNTRYGLYFFPAVVIFSGYFVLFLKKFNVKNKLIKILYILIILQQLLLLTNFPYNIPGLLEGIYNMNQTNENLCKYLKENYQGGFLLYDNTVFALLPKVGIDLKNRITFHTPEIGELSMNTPSKYVEWVLFNTKNEDDKIHIAMKNNEDFKNNFILKFSEEGIELYKRNINR